MVGVTTVLADIQKRFRGRVPDEIELLPNVREQTNVRLRSIVLRMRYSSSR